MEKTRKNLTMDPVTTRIVEGKSSEEICYLIQIGSGEKSDLEVTNLVEAMFEEVQELKEMTKDLAKLIIKNE